MNVCGIDYSSKAVDMVFVHLDDLQPPVWFRVELAGDNAFDRTRTVHLPASFFDDTLAVGIEEPRGQNAGAIYRVQGAILAALPRNTLVHPWVPSAWRRAVGLPGNASKSDILHHSDELLPEVWPVWPQDAHDAHCIALATRAVISREQAA